MTQHISSGMIIEKKMLEMAFFSAQIRNNDAPPPSQLHNFKITISIPGAISNNLLSVFPYIYRKVLTLCAPQWVKNNGICFIGLLPTMICLNACPHRGVSQEYCRHTDKISKQLLKGTCVGAKKSAHSVLSHVMECTSRFFS